MASLSSTISRKFAFEDLRHPRTVVAAAAPADDPPIMPPPLLSRESVSTVSESTDSSPTTASSTFDSPIICETSASSSPESPMSAIPLPSISLTHEHGEKLPLVQPCRPPPSTSPLPADSLARRAKNLKNLSLRLPASPFRQSLSTAPIRESGRHLSEPPSPVRPHSRGSRRRPPNLTIQTPAFQRPFSSNGTPAVPPTPNARPSLRHIGSSPSLSSILSPTQPHYSFPAPFASIPSSSGIRSDVDSSNGILSSNINTFNPNEPLLEFREEDDDCPISRESRKGSEKGYPDGPICIYDSGLYLYLEPNREEASQFDVVFNVAKEVKNPFKADNPSQDTVMAVWKATLAGSNTTSHVEEPVTATSLISFKSAFESLSNIPLPTPKTGLSEPEYIHVPWDHNSEILEDLFPLCEIIDDRISKGKKVLIHCQLGVSRSASLVIAYGLYKNPHLDFNTVYGKVKERSCWVGPNMSLIYQLTDFRTKVRCGTVAKSPVVESNHAAAAIPPPEKRDGPSPSPSASSSSSSSSSPMRKSPSDPSRLFAQVNPFNSTNRVRRNIAPRPLPLREKFHTIASLRNSPRLDGLAAAAAAAATTYHRRPPAFQMDLVMQDVPPSPSFFSPRAAEFTATPLARSNAGDNLALRKTAVVAAVAAAAATTTTTTTTTTTKELESPTLVRRPSLNDPRSPQRRTEPIIMRSIDEFL
ncbi:tyrosine/serine/threonine protein phosphatase [Ophidiomyces ophidiicola]|nr:tyrosine/serine/threonine protein phosphatase [Ophidiomyces ophidiicola]